MFLASFPSSSVAILSPIPPRSLLFKFRAYVAPLQSAPNLSSPKRSLLLDSLRLLEWDKVCDSVASFAGTSPGREATKSRLWSVSSSFEESKNLLAETNAAVAMLNYGAGGIDLSGLDLVLVKSASDRAMRGVPMEGLEALAVASLLLFAEMLQSTLKAAMKEDADWYNRFMPLSELIMDFVVNRTLIKSIQQVIDEDGSVKDSASLDLRRSREQVQMLESKLYQLMDSLIRTQSSETSALEVSNIDGRWCIKSGDDQHTSLTGLLLSSASGVESLIEPISAVPLNDELQQARASVAKAEEAVLSRLTNKMQADLSNIKNLLNAIIQMDVVIARAKYSLAYEGTCPEFSLTSDSGESLSSDGYPPTNGKPFENLHLSNPNQKEWTLYLRKAYHPLLLEKHRENMKKARKDVSDTIAERRRRRLQGGGITSKENLDAHLASLKTKVTDLDGSYPVPVDILITVKTRVVVITGPNTGGKTISLKTVGLAALMAKSGLYVLASEPVKIPWFDSVFADIGDEQSLAQSLSTFSGHLKQISAIQAESTSKSLVLLDEVGAGTNPLEGAALGMSLLEGFAEHALLTLATTHHGELKTLKYSNAAFENACMEFDEVNLKPTYKILWGIPGRSNAINIAERLGLPCTILDNARKLYGTTSAELNETIVDMERFKQDFHHHTHEAQNYLKLSKELHEKLLVAKQEISEHIVIQRYKKMKEISETAVHARSALRNKVREFRASNTFPSKINGEIKTTYDTVNTVPSNSSPPVEKPKKSHSDKQIKIPEVGDVVHISSLRNKVTVLKVEASKGEVMVLANNMKLRLKLSDIEA